MNILMRRGVDASHPTPVEVKITGEDSYLILSLKKQGFVEVTEAAPEATVGEGSAPVEEPKKSLKKAKKTS